MNSSFLPLILCFLLFRYTEPLSEGSFCKRRRDGLAGYCLLPHQCIHVIKEFLEKGIEIDICSMKGNKRIICCPLEEKAKQDFNIRKHNNRLAYQKCLEYSELSEQNCSPGQPLIVGGSKTLHGEFPHMAALGWNKGDKNVHWACGGSLISENFVLTAAHCVEINGPPDIIRLGAQNLNINANEDGSNDFEIEKIFPHPNYSTNSYYHDIALIRLKKIVKFNRFILPACIDQIQIDNSIEVVATGWGRIEFFGKKSDELLKVDLQVLNKNQCEIFYSSQEKLEHGIINSQFCAGHLPGGKDTCRGDSGGPVHKFFYGKTCLKHIVGITSFGKFCGIRNSPAVYTYIYYYLDWIEKIVFLN